MTMHVLCGPPASGKTRFRLAIANKLECRRVVDGVDAHELATFARSPAGTLIITNAPASVARRALPAAKVHEIGDFGAAIEGVDVHELAPVEICDPRAGRRGLN